MSYLIYSAVCKLGYPELGAMIFSDPPIEVYDGIYIGSVSTATSEAGLTAANIGAIVDLSGYSYIRVKPTLTLYMDDTDVTCETVKSYIDKFEHGANAITRARENNINILVHCAAGVNRSATQIAYYLIKQGMSYETAYEKLLVANTIRKMPLLTNHTFVNLLKAHGAYYNRQLKDGGVIGEATV